jgi:hypothetical protein
MPLEVKSAKHFESVRGGLRAPERHPIEPGGHPVASRTIRNRPGRARLIEIAMPGWECPQGKRSGIHSRPNPSRRANGLADTKLAGPVGQAGHDRKPASRAYRDTSLILNMSIEFVGFQMVRNWGGSDPIRRLKVTLAGCDTDEID